MKSQPLGGWRVLVTLPATLSVVALCGLLAFGAPGRGDVALAGPHATHEVRSAVSERAVALREDMRTLWEQHTTWTRLAIVDFAADSPGLSATTDRLLRNQTDIGNAIARYYGKPAGRTLTGLLRTHILVAVDVLGAAKAGDQTALARAQASWGRNANQIADFLWRANPNAWHRREMRQMMHAHLKLTTDEAVARLTGNYRTDVRAFDDVQRQALMMADMLSAGIVAQFPQRFR